MDEAHTSPSSHGHGDRPKSASRPLSGKRSKANPSSAKSDDNVEDEVRRELERITSGKAPAANKDSDVNIPMLSLRKPSKALDHDDEKDNGKRRKSQPSPYTRLMATSGSPRTDLDPQTPKTGSSPTPKLDIPFRRTGGDRVALSSWSDDDKSSASLVASGSGLSLNSPPRSPRAQKLARKPKVSQNRTRWTVLETQPGLLSKNQAFLPDPTPCTILAVVPFFNESPEDLYRTLRDIYINQAEIRKKAVVNSNVHTTDAIIHVMVIMDGYNKADQRTIEWCRRLFPSDPWEVLEHLRPDKKETPEVVRWFQKQVKKDSDDFEDAWELKLRGMSVAPGAYDADGKHFPRRGIIQGTQTLRVAASDPLKDYAVIFQNASDIRTMDTLGLTKVTKPRPPLEERTYFSEVMKHDTFYCNPCDRCETGYPTDDLEFFEIPMTLLVKTRNRQKHDSHWWSLCPNGFISCYQDARYVFFTDCGTLFHPNCIFEMVKEIESNPNAGAVTGRQRVMSAVQQNEEGEGFVSEFLRHVQRCDFELSFATSVGAFAAAGCLPVLPGPCGLYRLDIILCGAGEFYHSFLEMDPTEIGVIEGNVMIAEDRILSLSPFFSQAPKHWKEKHGEPITEIQNFPDCSTIVAPEATFYYEAENNLTSLIKQRRRWVNGTIACYLWLLFKKPGLVWQFNISVFRKLLIYYLFFIQAYSYLFTFLSPAVFLIIFRTAVRDLKWQDSLYSEYWFIIFLILYVLFMYASSERKSAAWMYYFGFIIGFVIEVLSITGIAYSAVTQALMTNTTDLFLENGGKIVGGKVMPPPLWIQNFSLFDLVPLGLLVLSAVIPLLAALIVSPLSFVYILRSGVQFLFFLPTLVAIFGAFSIANFSDFSWGNRDSTGSADKIGPRLATLVERGKFYGFFFLGLNFTLVFLSLDLFSIPYWRMISSAFLFVPPLTSLLISCCYWIYWRIAHWCCRDGCRKVMSKKINLKSLSEAEKVPIRQIVKLLHAKDV